MREPSDLIAQLTRAVAATTPDANLTLRLCTAMTEVLGFQGGAMAVHLETDSRTTLCVTDDFASRLDDLETVLQQGPTLDAHRGGALVTATPEDLPRRWPLLARSMADQLAPAYLMAIPMRPETTILGVLTFHGPHPASRGWDPAEPQLLANAIGIAVLGGVDRAQDPDELWSTRDRTNQAVGMVVAQLRIAPPDALAVLRAHAFADGSSLADIANRVVGGRLDFGTSGDDPSGSRGSA